MDLDAPAFSPAVDAPVCVALSGGMDSMALLTALAGETACRTRGLRALHVHHGLHPDADEWATLCAEECARLDVELIVDRVQVRATGLGREGAAREARHAAFARHLRAGEHLALAHHRDDQAETFLLRALRASGVDGLGAMAPLRTLGRGVAWRPWLQVSRAEIEAYGRDKSLRWVVDPSNADPTLDRNFLRHRVMPLLRERWPHADSALVASAAHARDAAALLAMEDRDALATSMLERADVLSIPALRALPELRRARVLRAWVASLDLPPLPARTLHRVEAELLHARSDAQPRIDWSGAVLRAWRDRLYAARAQPPLDPGFETTWDGTGPLHLPDGGRLAFTARAALPSSLRVHARRGGERIQLQGRRHSHALKHVLQSLQLPPWTREHLPLLSDDDGLLAAGDVAISARLYALLDASGARLLWTRPPAA